MRRRQGRERGGVARRPRIEGLERRELLATTITEFPITTAGSQPTGIVTGPDGNLWFTESNANQIGQITPAGVVTEFPIPTPGSKPQQISDGPAGNGDLYFTEATANQIGQITTTGTVTEFPIPTAGAQPQGITAGPADVGNLWFTELAGNQIGEFNPGTATFTEFPVPTLNAGVSGITVGPDENLWFTEATANKIGMFNPVTDTFTEYPIPTANSTPTGITVGPDGALWFTESSGNQIGRIDPTSGAITEYPVLTAGAQPESIVSGTTVDGNLWFTELTADKIGRINPITNVVTEFTVPTGSAGPTGITVGPDNHLWFTENLANQIGDLNPTQILIPTGVPVSGQAETALTSVVATFAAPTLNLPLSNYTATIDWGDDTTSAATSIQTPSTGVLSVTGTHTYATSGTFTITTTLSDGVGDTAIATSQATISAAPTPPGEAPYVVNVYRESGPRQPGVIVIGFNEALDPSAADNVLNYTIIALGPYRRLDTAGEIAGGYATNLYLHVTSAIYNTANNTVTLTTYERLSVRELYLLEVNGRLAHPTASGESPDGLSNTSAVLLDGNFDGQPGSDYVTIVPKVGRALVSPTATTTAAAVHAVSAHKRVRVIHHPARHVRERRR